MRKGLDRKELKCKELEREGLKGLFFLLAYHKKHLDSECLLQLHI
jgi:hypothetical protein